MHSHPSGALYGALMLTSSMAIRTPHPDYKVPGLVDDTAKDEPSTAPVEQVRRLSSSSPRCAVAKVDVKT